MRVTGVSLYGNHANQLELVAKQDGDVKTAL